MRNFEHEWLIQTADFTTTDFVALEQYLEDHPSMLLRIYGHDGVVDLEFLKSFSKLRHFSCSVWSLESFDGLRHLSTDLQSLVIGQTRRTLSLRGLSRFANLERLTLEKQKKDIDALSSLTHLRELSLTSMSLPGLSSLMPLQSLVSLGIALGGTKDVSLLPELRTLKFLGLRIIKGLSDIGAIGRMNALEYLYLEELKHVTRLPRLSELKHLRRIHLETMNGLTDLAPLAEVENLEELAVFNMRLSPENFAILKGHPRLKAISVGIGTMTRNEEVNSMLGLPRLAHPRIIGMLGEKTN